MPFGIVRSKEPVTLVPAGAGSNCAIATLLTQLQSFSNSIEQYMNPFAGIVY